MTKHIVPVGNAVDATPRILAFRAPSCRLKFPKGSVSTTLSVSCRTSRDSASRMCTAPRFSVCLEAFTGTAHRCADVSRLVVDWLLVGVGLQMLVEFERRRIIPSRNCSATALRGQAFGRARSADVPIRCRTLCGASAKDLIAPIREGDQNNSNSCAKVIVSGEYIGHHVQEARNEISIKAHAAKKVSRAATRDELMACGEELKADLQVET